MLYIIFLIAHNRHLRRVYGGSVSLVDTVAVEALSDSALGYEFPFLPEIQLSRRDERQRLSHHKGSGTASAGTSRRRRW